MRAFDIRRCAAAMTIAGGLAATGFAAGGAHAAVMLVGGTGDFEEVKGNFLLRIRDRLTAAGLLLAFPDVPSDRKARALTDFRSDPRHAEDVRAVVAHLRRRADAPVFLIGTSRGTISAANAAARLGPDLVAGAILSSTLTGRVRQNPENVFDAPLGQVRVPVLLLHHSDDRCHVTPARHVGNVRDALARSPRAEVRMLSGGWPAKASDECAALANHGFYGLYDQAVAAMVGWLDEVLRAAPAGR